MKITFHGQSFFVLLAFSSKNHLKNWPIRRGMNNRKSDKENEDATYFSYI